jgi:UDP-glucose 4-epimerase
MNLRNSTSTGAARGKVLVTGGAGFVGANLVRLLREEGTVPIVIDNLSEGVNYLPEDIELHSLDCANIADYPELLHDTDAIVHLAGKPSVEFANLDPVGALESNVADTLKLLLAAAGASVSRFVFASSSAAVGLVDGPINENLPARPASLYGASKLAAEAYCHAAARSLGIETVILRFANVYGPLSQHKQSVIHKFVRAGLNGQQVTIYGDGTQTRDFIYVKDVCHAVLRAVYCQSGSSIFQIGTGTATSILQVCEVLEDVLGRDIERRFVGSRLGDVQASLSNSHQASEQMAWEPKFGLREGLRHTVAYYQGVLSEEREPMK